jgi:hypothetical protein
LAKSCNLATGGPEQGIDAEDSLDNPDGDCPWPALLQAGGMGGAGQWSLLGLVHCTSGLLDETNQKSAATSLIL